VSSSIFISEAQRSRINSMQHYSFQLFLLLATVVQWGNIIPVQLAKSSSQHLCFSHLTHLRKYVYRYSESWPSCVISLESAPSPH